MAGLITNVGLQFETMSLNSVVAGFSFASAIAWMDVVRWMISQVVRVNKNGGQYYIISAIFTTLLAVFIFLVVSTVAKNVKITQGQTVYAVGR